MKFFVIGTGNACREAVKQISQTEGFSVAGIATTADDALAKEPGYDVFIVQGNNAELEETIAAKSPDIILSVVSPVLLPASILKLAAKYSVNIHPGLLPHYTGFYPQLWALINGEKKFGVTLHQMEAKVDAGGIFGVEYFDIDEDDTGIKVYMKVLKASKTLISRFLETLKTGGEVKFEKQDLSNRKLYKKSDLDNYFISSGNTVAEAMRAYRAHQFRPFPSPLGDLKLKHDSQLIHIQKMKALKEGENVFPGAVSYQLKDGFVLIEEAEKQSPEKIFKNVGTQL